MLFSFADHRLHESWYLAFRDHKLQVPDKLQHRHGSISGVVDVDNAAMQKLCEECGISAMPTLVLFKEPWLP